MRECKVPLLSAPNLIHQHAGSKLPPLQFHTSHPNLSLLPDPASPAQRASPSPAILRIAKAARIQNKSRSPLQSSPPAAEPATRCARPAQTENAAAPTRKPPPSPPRTP